MKKPYVTMELVVTSLLTDDIVRTSDVESFTLGTDNAGYWDEAW